MNPARRDLRPVASSMIDGPGPRRSALPPQLVAMVRRVPPTGAPVVRGSVPVVAFGDPERAEVATLGINPSHREFAENGVLLSGQQRRLATLESLGPPSLVSSPTARSAT